MSLGEVLKKLRKERGLSQEELCKMAGISRRAYIDYENNKTKPATKAIYLSIARALDCEVELLLNCNTDDSLLDKAATIATKIAVATNPVAAAINLTASANKLLSSKPKASNQNDSKKDIHLAIQEHEKKQKQFKILSKGIILSSFTNNGIIFSLIPTNNNSSVTFPDEIIQISSKYINSWEFVFWSKESEQIFKSFMSLKDRATFLFSKFFYTTPDQNKKSSIVVDSKELFKTLIQFKDKNSYKGNLSVILINTDDCTIEQEVNIAFYDESCEKTILNIKD